jgi:2-polyprenyl-3-methyl-5-hydroxy-6-metoxy-1,4-benzoquinol methylase
MICRAYFTWSLLNLRPSAAESGWRESLRGYYPEDYTAYEPIIDRERHYWLTGATGCGSACVRSSLQPGGRLLDVGCGTGIFLAEAQRAG